MRRLDWLRRKATAYQRLFEPAITGSQTDAAIVLADLRKFCYHTRSTVKVSPVLRMVDPLATAHAEGRREVLVMILAYLNFDERQVSKLVNDEEGNLE